MCFALVPVQAFYPWLLFTRLSVSLVSVPRIADYYLGCRSPIYSFNAPLQPLVGSSLPTRVVLWLSFLVA